MSRINSGMFTSERPDWETPQPLFDLLDGEFGFSLDAAASVRNNKCARFYTPTEDALIQPWHGVVFCNPPYGRGINRWVAKGFNEAQNGATVVMLIPARTDTAWWHDYVMRASEIRLVRGRPVFVHPEGGTTSNAPFPVAVVVFRQADHLARVSSTGRGSHLLRRSVA